MCDINVSVIRIFKRFFAIVFFIMVFALLSSGALVHAGSNGVCGTALNWTLTDEGQLTITGTGDMYDYDETTFWDRSRVKGVEMPEGLTSIGKSAFMACTSLSEVNIPSSVTSIGDSAFRACTNLSEITIPSKVTSVGSFSFNNCANLTNVTISEGVTNIGDEVFHSCRKLSVITVPASVTSMGLNVFKDCENLELVLLPAALKDSESRKSLDISENTQIYFYDGKCGDDLAWTLTDDGELTIVGVGNMYDYNEAKFWDCAKVKKVDFKESANSIGNSVFKGCACVNDI